MPEKIYEESRCLEAEFRIVDADERAGVIEGIAAPFDKWTNVNGQYLEKILPDTFRQSVSESGHKIPLLLHHDHQTAPIGKALEWRELEHGLHAVWQVDTESERGAEAWRLARDGFMSGLSVGFQPNRPQDADDMENGVRRVVRGAGARLFEVSMVSVAAYADAQITLTRTAGLEYRPDPRISMYREMMAAGVFDGD